MALGEGVVCCWCSQPIAEDIGGVMPGTCGHRIHWTCNQEWYTKPEGIYVKNWPCGCSLTLEQKKKANYLINPVKGLKCNE
ncbi:Protein of unknown function [Pyronema omphalodes CBS 100304]|uniref:Uncharacterized protein n=1 Tax=Pyronema omphalodes (strain CBS 100304) TaxID=1076935 RepID=U4LLW6_PYROM|nr:Protein of unknown function [Pyronema omphalodes CBS 100304]